MKTAISLFSGCGGDTLGLTRAGYKVIAFSEFNNAAVESHLANFPESELIQANPMPDIKKKDLTNISYIQDAVFAKYRDRVDVIFAGFPCFVKDTIVLTDNGYKPIQDVTLEDKLMTHSGKFQSIINLQNKVHSGDVYDLRIKYHSELITATGEHPFYVREKKRMWNNSIRKYEYSFGEPQWKPASELTMNDYFGMCINDKENIPTFTFEKKINQHRNEKVEIKLDNEDQWYMMGYFVGDGWIEDTLKTNGNHAHKIRFSVHNDDNYIVERISRVLPIKDKLADSGKCNKYGCADIIWHTILKKFGKYAHGKLIPEWVQDAPKNLLREFVKGYMDADGCQCKNGVYRIVTVSPNLAYGLQRIYLKLGQLASVEKTIRPKTCVIQGRTVNQRDTYQVCYTPEKKVQHSSHIDGNYAWYAPLKITKRRVENEPVYNFEVSEDNSYVIHNIVCHNCQGTSRAGNKRPDDPRNQMYLQFVRATANIRPKFVIGENVTGLLTMKSGTDPSSPLLLDLILKAFKEIGYELTYKQQEATDFGVPQKRKRIILVGYDTTQVTNFNPTEFWTRVQEESTKLPRISQADFVTNSMEGAALIPPTNIPEYFATYAQPVTQTTEPTGKPHPYVTLKIAENLLSCSKRDSPIHSEIINKQAPSKTIICTYDHQPRLLVGLRKPDGTSFARTLLPDELKQIQGFPADYQIRGTLKEQVVQIGNAVPPPMIEAVVKALPHTSSPSTSTPTTIRFRRMKRTDKE